MTGAALCKNNYHPPKFETGKKKKLKETQSAALQLMENAWKTRGERIV